ncbi:MAG: hydrogenase maturation nickel metallochaperone HypA [bacterium]|nr:hydrogenase maturation nickel metallochaperone HypA [bacterium]MCP5044578.1 hydrogenase maturation nickel metallochaperone HypA [bacterium]
MHELSIASEIYRSCREEISRKGGGRLLDVRVAVGELSAVEPELLGFAWEAVTSAGPDAGAKLDVEWHPVRQSCPQCGQVDEPQPGSWLRRCPQCSDALRLEGGRELDLLTFGFEAAHAAELRP